LSSIKIKKEHRGMDGSKIIRGMRLGWIRTKLPGGEYSRGPHPSLKGYKMDKGNGKKGEMALEAES
jgi:hypothetical protein